ncbi:hypothetical protein [Streptomyces sirii]|uniref:hypothetical protein n=1 Tax=Streptomyces sirii TaxID=3127701 RepID=UPI003D36841D
MRRTRRDAQAARDFVLADKKTVIRRHVEDGEPVYKIADDYKVGREFLGGLLDFWGVKLRSTRSGYNQTE